MTTIIQQNNKKQNPKMFFMRKKYRPLTAGERKIAKSVFGNDLDVNCIWIKTAFWVLPGYSVSPNGCIYFHRDDWCEDFSRRPLVHRAWLVHELVHVWQVQKGMSVFWRALLNRKYDYKLQSGKLLMQYGIEQQARIVEDYYIRRERGACCKVYEDCLPKQWFD